MTLSLCLLAVLAAAQAGCGKARSRGSSSSTDAAALSPCRPLAQGALSASLTEAVSVGRDRAGTLYALSRVEGLVSSRAIAWRSLGDRLIAYPVFREQGGTSGKIFGVDDGGAGFALSLIPERQPTVFRLFSELADAAPSNGSGDTTTRGTNLELLPREQLAAFRTATGSSPAQLIGWYRTEQFIDAAPSADLVLVRRDVTDEAPPAIFFGTGGVLLERELLSSDAQGELLAVQFELDGEPALLRVEVSGGPAQLALGGEVQTLLRGADTPLGLAQLEFRCAGSVPADWLPGVEPELRAPSCATAPRSFVCVESSATTPGASLVTDLADASVAALGAGVPPEAAGDCALRAAELAGDTGALALWTRLVHGTGETWIVTGGRESELPLRLGDTVALHAWQLPAAEQTPAQLELALRSTAGELLLWLADVRDFSMLQGVAELELTRGPESCARTEYCAGGFSQHALDVWNGSESVRVAVGADAQQGALRVHNGGIEVQSGDPGCYGAPEPALKFAVWRSPAGP
jgi:hypothetical protein